MSKSAAESGYSVELADRAKRVCLLVATVLGDLMDDLVVVGGLVPYLIIDQERAAVRHVGTKDLDIGLKLTLLDEERYKTVSERLRGAGFVQGVNQRGRPSRQTWVHNGQSVDFLIPPPAWGGAPGKVQNLEADWAAFIMPAVALAFQDFIPVTIDGQTPDGARAKRTINVCGPAAFVVSKALAYRGRSSQKDAYDLVYMLKHYGERPLVEVVARFQPFAEDEVARSALTALAEDFSTADHIGPRATARFMTGEEDPELLQDAVTYVQALLAALSSPPE
jgi:hypothetical protein